MCLANPLWGAPRILGELLKLGIQISQGTVAKYMLRRPHSPSLTWRTFLRNHALGLAAIDMFIVPSATFRLLLDRKSRAHARFSRDSPVGARTDRLVDGANRIRTARRLVSRQSAIKTHRHRRSPIPQLRGCRRERAFTVMPHAGCGRMRCSDDFSRSRVEDFDAPLVVVPSRP
jgi:hypothetical protein